MKPTAAPRPGPPVRLSPSRAPSVANQHAPSHRANGCCPVGSRAHASPTTTARRYARSSARTDTSQPPHRTAPGDKLTTPRRDRATHGPGAAHASPVRHGVPAVTGPRPVPMSRTPSGAWRTDAGRQHCVAPRPRAPHTGSSPGTVEAHRPGRARRTVRGRGPIRRPRTPTHTAPRARHRTATPPGNRRPCGVARLAAKTLKAPRNQPG